MAKGATGTSGTRGVYNPVRLLLHYGLFVSLVLGMLVAGVLLQRHSVAESERSMEAAALVSRERMLSQRILFLASEYQEKGVSGDAALLEAQIVLYADFYGRIHDLIKDLDGARDRFDFAFDGRVMDFAALARRVLEAPPRSQAGAEAMAALRRAGMSGLLADLDALEAAFAADARASQETLATFQRTILVAVLGLLLLEGVFVFWPTHRATIASLGRLESRNSAMEEENEALEDQARELAITAFHDPLTGLMNRKRLYEHLEGLLGLDPSRREAVCAMHIDLDYFKELNDTHGHATGDAALRHVAEIMLAASSRKAVVARIGGDEFVIATEVDGEEREERIHGIGEELIERISRPMVVNGVDIRLGASIGYTFASAGTADAQALIAEADMALYEAKRAGKGVVRRFTRAMQEQVTRRRMIATEMERALEAGEFVPHFQPIVSLPAGTVEGIEMLARWAHPQRGLIEPEEFMPIAEEIGIMDAIDSRIFIDGLDALAELRRARPTLPRLSINASTRTMRYDDYAERLTDAVRARGFEPESIVVEVLETSLVAATSDQTARTVSKLRALGYNVCVDEFGTGYSSLLNLANLDVTGLKIHRSLIGDIERDRARQIVKAIVGLAEAMSLTVMADGVETERQRDEVSWLGVDAAQGVTFAPAMPAEALADWLDRHRSSGGEAPTARRASSA